MRRGLWWISTTSPRTLTLLRDLLDRVPDTELPLDEIPWPALLHESLKERFTVLDPIPSYAPAVEKKRSGHKHHHKHKHHEQ